MPVKMNRAWLIVTAVIAIACAARLSAQAPSPANTPTVSTAAATATQVQNSDPVRMARFSYVQGDVQWRAGDSDAWAPAAVNVPLLELAQITVAAGARAEIQFDDGSYLRLGGGALAIFRTLFSDAQGEFTEIELHSGLASVSVRSDRSIFQFDTPLASVKAAGPARVRVGVSEGVEVAVTVGVAAVEGPNGKIMVTRGDYLDLHDANSPLQLQDLPPADSWQNWNDDRDKLAEDAEQSLERHDVPDNIALIAGNLDAYGTWESEPSYGIVWLPRTISAEWRPYYAGRWIWVTPFGWTWQSDEPWGWAPYHYGTWLHSINGWAWRPGPAHQYWSPAIVEFSMLSGTVAWCPLAPDEVQYPNTLATSFGASWPQYFSISAVGTYYPTSTAIWQGRAFNRNSGNGPAEANATNATNQEWIAGGISSAPINAVSGAGATAVAASDFGKRSHFTPLVAGSAAIFKKGNHPAAPRRGQEPMSGPPAPDRSTVQIAGTQSSNTLQALAARPVYRAALSPVQQAPGSRPASQTASRPTDKVKSEGPAKVAALSGIAAAALAARASLPPPAPIAAAAVRAAPGGTHSINPSTDSAGARGGYLGGRSYGGTAPAQSSGTAPSGSRTPVTGSTSGGIVVPVTRPTTSTGAGNNAPASGGYHVTGGAAPVAPTRRP